MNSDMLTLKALKRVPALHRSRFDAAVAEVDISKLFVDGGFAQV